MRHLVLAFAACSLALAGCGKKSATGNTSALDQAVTAEDFAANDATAIDAATGADANMAADVDINVIENAENGSASDAPKRNRPRSASSGNSAEPSAAPEQPAAPPPTPAESNTN
jgi:hypothetical protein